MKIALIDTDTISFYFRNNKNVVSLLENYLNIFGYLNISVISYYEILNGLYYKDAKKQLNSFLTFVSLNQVIQLDKEIAQTAANIYSNLRREGRLIGHNDVLIAATAIVHKMKLISNNTEHFGRISELEIDNWVI